jgi:hypothetical protein
MNALKNLLLLGFLGTLLPLSHASNGLGENLRFSHNGTTGKLFWEAVEGRVYFFQTSENLTQWDYYPAISSDTIGFTEWSVLLDADSDKAFLRLIYTDRFMFDPNSEDLDGDSVSNMDEISQVPPTDPFSAVDSDGNGLFDDWETFYSLTNPVADEEPDTLSNQVESLIGSHPMKGYITTSALEVFTPN